MTPTDPAEEIGASGVGRISGGFNDEIKQLRDPQRRNRIWQEMGDNDPIIGATLFAIEMLIRQVKWTVEGDNEATREFVDECLGDMLRSWEATVADILSFLQFGWSWHEIVFKLRRGMQPEVELDAGGNVVGELPPPSSKFSDGKWGWHKMAGRPQSTLSSWKLDAHGEVLAFVQAPPPHFKPLPIPRSKSLHFVTTTKGGSPEGRSMLRSAYRPWFFKKTIEETQAIGIERDLAGLAILRIPAELLKSSSLTSAESATLEEMQKIIRNVKRGAQDGVLLPNTRKDGEYTHVLTLLSTGGRRQFDTKAILEYYDQRMAMMALADFILLGHEKVGSFALSADKTEIFSIAIGAWLDTIASEINTRAIPMLLELNGLPVEDAPTIEHGPLESIPLDVLGKYITDLASAGVPLFPDEDLESHLREVAGLPEASETALPPPPPPPPVFAPPPVEADGDA